jgi:hypothetical protein
MSMFENRTPVSFVKAKDGKMLVSQGKNADGTVKEALKFDSVTGKIIDITTREFQYNGKPILTWQVTLLNGNETAIFSMAYSSNFARSFFNSVANGDLKKAFKLSCYVKNEFNSPTVVQDGQLVRWKYSEMPKLEDVIVGSKTIKDDAKAVAWTEQVVQEIKALIEAPAPEVVGIDTHTVPSQDGFMEEEFADLPV